MNLLHPLLKVCSLLQAGVSKGRTSQQYLRVYSAHSPAFLTILDIMTLVNSEIYLQIVKADSTASEQAQPLGSAFQCHLLYPTLSSHLRFHPSEVCLLPSTLAKANTVSSQPTPPFLDRTTL